ncbi:efflux RND transporter permease subunit [Cytophagaceae bacterium DM2B3-1]|uniref:Efflux RND transporter permease subunit n=1 Tax=Xanthocytophaga flava TaxID=3048013 RepID=A0ABT7CTZ1_9BACT|nr:efflux RND transporter permease subunit [Xanthocytophaga flavus]MDJ1471777.1 efflux RND transporter permease subunit [Xanthocytophaga flavus]MDJ1497198.1 efflux RND transporter permease subunit [Xanthocytophaga flavus]
MSITEISIKRPALVIVIFTVLGILGLLSYSQLNYNLLPKFEAPVMSVITLYPGAAAGEVETSVTKKIEDALSSLENLDKIQSTSQEGVSMVVIQLLQSANVDESVQDAQRKVNSILSQLPDDVEAPTINKFSTDDLPILQMGVSANVSPTTFYKMVEDRIQPQLAKIQGVGQITLVGGEERQIKVNLDPERLQAYHLSLNQVTQAIITANQDFPTGKVETTDQQYSLRIAAKFTSLDQLRKLVISNQPNGSRITLEDIAEVEDGIAEITTINRINGRTSIGLIVQKQADANAVDVSKKVKAELSKIEKMYAAEKVKFNIANDSSIYTLASANAVQEDLILAVIIVAAVMLIFLHSLRSSLIVMVAIPASMISTFILMYVFNFSLNLMTLMALSLVVGILVDDSIVVLENIYRHMEMGKDKRTAALDGRNEIGFTALAITLVDVVVFLPMSLVSGLIGNILREFALVVVFSTLMSLFVSFTITPMLASRFGKLDHFTKNTLWGRISLGFEDLFTRLQDFYTRILKWSLGHRWAIYLGAFILFVGSIALVPAGFIGSEFAAQGDRGEMIIQLELEPQVTMYQNNQTTRKVEQLLMEQPEVKLVLSKVGYTSAQMGAGTGSNNRSELTVLLVDRKERSVTTEEFGAKIKEKIQKLPGIKAKAAATSITGNANTAPVQIVLKGTDLEKVRQAAEMVMGVVKKTPGTTDVEFSVEDPNPELQVQLDRERMASLGLSVSDVGSTLRTAFNGNDDSKYREGQYEYDINIALDRFNRANSEDVSNIPFVNNQGKLVSLKQFATVSQELGASKLERRDRLSAITVNAQVVGRPIGTVGADIQKVMQTKKLPEGIVIEYAGSLQQQSDAFGSLGIALLIAIVFVYLIMVALYDSFLYPFIVLFSLPVALIGALVALALALENLSIFSIIGMIMLMGLVAKNAILLVDFTNHLKEQGMPVREALVEAGRERLRPILMTTIAMIFGMLPIALASGAGAETKNGLAWVIIGGLTSSLLLTLVLVPSAYLTFELAITKVKKRFGRKSDSIAPVPSLSEETK